MTRRIWRRRPLRSVRLQGCRLLREALGPLWDLEPVSLGVGERLHGLLAGARCASATDTSDVATTRAAVRAIMVFVNIVMSPAVKFTPCWCGCIIIESEGAINCPDVLRCGFHDGQKNARKRTRLKENRPVPARASQAILWYQRRKMSLELDAAGRCESRGQECLYSR